MSNAIGETAVARFEQLQGDRSPFLRRAQDCSKLTIPTLIPELHLVQLQRLKLLFKL